jgi:hypothetical protein
MDPYEDFTNYANLGTGLYLRIKSIAYIKFSVTYDSRYFVRV